MAQRMLQAFAGIPKRQALPQVPCSMEEDLMFRSGLMMVALALVRVVQAQGGYHSVQHSCARQAFNNGRSTRANAGREHDPPRVNALVRGESA